MTHPRIIQLAVPYATKPEQKNGMTYYEWGDVANPRVAFCVHGLTRTGRDFDTLAEALCATHRVIAVDMPGRGLSEWLTHKEEYALPAYLMHLEAFFTALGLGQVDWVGTSMGGMIAMATAAINPVRIRKMVLNDVGAEIPASALARLSEYVGVQTHFDTRELAEQALRKSYQNFGVREEWQWQQLIDHSIHEEMDGSIRLHYDPAIGDVLRGAGEPPQTIELWEMWEKVTCPTLLIRGAESDLLTRATVAKMKAMHEDLTLHEVQDAGHAPTLMDKAEIELICNWLDA